MDSLFRSLDPKYLCIYHDYKGAIDFIASAQPHEGPFHTLPTDPGSPVQFSSGLPACVTGISSVKGALVSSPATACPVSPWNPLTWTSGPGLSSWDSSHYCDYRPAWSLQDLISTLTSGLAFQLGPRPASSLWHTPMIQILRWLWPSSLRLPCSPHWVLWDSVCCPWDFPLDAWLSFSDSSALIILGWRNFALAFKKH